MIRNSPEHKFRIIPVIDILNGIAVHANKGLRNTYAPIESAISKSSSVIDLLKNFHDLFGFKEMYIADLDSIIHEKPNIDLLMEIANSFSLKIMLDAGIRNLYDILTLKKININKIILATETIDSLNVIKDGIKELGSERVIVSIDMRNKKLISRNSEISNIEIFKLIELIHEFGVTEIILLDLINIGTKTGCYDQLYGKIKQIYPEMNILIGGGAKNIDDLVLLRKKEMSGILIATALHDGSIKSSDIDKFLANS